MPRSNPYWWEAGVAPATPAEVALPGEVDVLVIGAGLTGLSAALTLARRGRSVLVLDGEAVGAGASTRNGGMIGGGHRLSLEAMEARFGMEQALALLREAQIESTAFCFDLIRSEGIECGLVQSGRFRGFSRRSEWEATARDLDRLQKLIPVRSVMVPKARQHEEINSDLYEGGVVFPDHGGLDPSRWVAGLHGLATSAGAIVQGHTAVEAVEGAGPAFRVTTRRGAVRAGTLLAATNGYTPAALPALRRRIIPIPSFIAATEPIGTSIVRACLPTGRMMTESRERHCYYRPSPDGERILFGARAAMFDAPQRLVVRELAQLLRQIFPRLASVGFTHVWRGRTGFTFDLLPNVGRIAGIWHAIGYCGNGNAMAPWLGHKAALGILGDPEGETAFARTPFSTRWWHRGGCWFLPALDVAYRARDLWHDYRRKP